MRRRLALLLALAAVVAASCGGPEPSPVSVPSGRTPAPVTPVAPVPSSSSSGGGGEGPAGAVAPRPNAPIPGGVRALVPAIERITRAVRDSVAEWTSQGDPSSWPPPETLVLQTLYQQRIYRALAQRRTLARRVLSRLPGSIRVEAAAIVRANAAVFSHATPVRPSYPIRTRAPEPADVLRGFFEKGERRFGVPWEVLAAVNYVETKFGRVISNSSAGAQGPMQFLPSTWAAYGLGGDLHDPHDAILGAANYLHANGAPRNVRGALYHYNPVPAYVDAVATYAAAIRRDPRLFYAMYCWQVYILTTRGDRRVTGPGV